MKTSVLAAALVFGSVVPGEAAETNSQVLRAVWNIGARRACSKEARARFNETAFAEVASRVSSAHDREELKRSLAPFLRSLGWSHTEFMTSKDESFHFFKSFAASKNPKSPRAPKFFNPGIQSGMDAKGFFAREVLDGTPARSGGVLKGDRLLSWRGQPFSGSWGFSPSMGSLLVEREGEALELRVSAPAVDWNDIFNEATKRSVRVYPVNGRRIGYVRLWTGAHKDSVVTLRRLVEGLSPKIDGLVLDLRGGYGGAWWEHLDPFFPDRKGFYQGESLDGDDIADIQKPEPKNNRKAYRGPMAVLINEGVRSGKEAMAYQFKKSARARLFGTKTPGYFSAGGFFFANDPVDYLFYLCVFRITLDGNVIEGVGISPDVEVPFAAQGRYADTQLEAALIHLSKN
jgi:carboxyl-terminal processing protease